MSAVQDGYFDDATILSICLAFDRTCRSLQACGVAATVQESVAIRIIEVAMQGEPNPDRLHDEALRAFDSEETRKLLAT
jgi:hypothetical protein